MGARPLTSFKKTGVMRSFSNSLCFLNLGSRVLMTKCRLGVGGPKPSATARARSNSAVRRKQISWNSRQAAGQSSRHRGPLCETISSRAGEYMTTKDFNICNGVVGHILEARVSPMAAIRSTRLNPDQYQRSRKSEDPTLTPRALSAARSVTN